jgi:AsmA protein
VVLVAAVATVYLGVNAKARVTAAAAEALGMEVSVGGRSAMGIFPALHFKLEDVHVRNRGAEVASAGEVDLGVAVLPLLHHEVRLEQVVLKRLRIAIDRNRAGKWNVDSSSQGQQDAVALDIAKISASDATLLYADESAGRRVDASECKLNVDRLQLPGGDHTDFMKNLSFAATLNCGQFRVADLAATDLALTVDAKSGTIAIEPIAMRLLGGLGSGSIHADYSGAVPVYELHGRLKQFRVEEFFKALSPQNGGTGFMDFSANLTLRGPLTGALAQASNGDASLHGKNLTLEMGDLDKKFSRYESSQNFNLVDVGAFFFAGPAGLAVTKGYDFARIFQKTEGTTTVRTLVSEWRVEHGVAHAQDVAMATPNNRVALKGNLDFVTGRFDEVTVALVDAKGCAQVVQKVRGPFLNPQVESPSLQKGITGPTRKLLARVGKLFGRKCEVFYSGAVAPSAGGS